jgi:hypothetical protein
MTLPPLKAVSRWLLGTTVFTIVLVAPTRAQEAHRPALRVGSLPSDLQLDGVLDEDAWATADAIGSLTMIDPVEGGPLTGHTTVRVLASAREIIIGVICRDPDPAGIVSYSKARDSQLRGEDHIKIIFDTFLDERSGYIFAVNPSGARYDALVARQGEGENSNWDAVWEAATANGADGWSVEIRIPVQSLSFDPTLQEWGFNVERRLERLQEVSRWSSPRRDAKISQTSRAGRLTGLPHFSIGVGLTVRPAVVGGGGKPGIDEDVSGTFEPSLDVQQRIGANVMASGTVNTDFGETEVDTRRTNLTRFSLFFPEKRTFFLEGSDIFDFGIGLQSSYRTELAPFHSRRIGLFDGEEVPLNVGGKMNGRVGNTNFGALAVRTGEVEQLVAATEMGAFRVKQNVLSESSAGVIATFGDPEGRAGSWMTGVDFTYQTSRLWGNKNFLAGAWVMATDRADLDGDKTAFGAKIDYPNDTWDVAITYKRIGDAFDPSLGFVPRKAVQLWGGGINFRYRPSWSWMRTMFYELLPTVAFDLDGQWESYRVFTAPVNWRFESGERFEFNIAPEGERLVAPFEIADGVIIPAGSYNWVRYRFELDVASRRKVSGRASWWFGDFYDGTLDQFTLRMAIKPSADISFELSAERNTGEVSAGSFRQELVSGRVLVNFSPDLQVNTFVQYDNDSRTVGTNMRLRWTFDPFGDVFVVYNHNVKKFLDLDLNPTDRWELESNQLIIKVQYALRW